MSSHTRLQPLLKIISNHRRFFFLQRFFSTKRKLETEIQLSHTSSSTLPSSTLPSSTKGTSISSNVSLPIVSALSGRRQAIEAYAVPRNLEEQLVNYFNGVLYALFAVTVGTLAFFIHRASQYDSESEIQALHVITTHLRTCRKRAKDALINVTTDSGEIFYNSGKGSIKWWSSGPRDAKISILLAASDGETAAVWGLVHAQLSKALIKKSVRIISFHRTDARTKSIPLTLRMRDMALLQEHSLLNSESSKTIIVQQGEGTWAGLAHASLNSEKVLGLVCVVPLINHRGRQMAWVDAAIDASRVAYADDPGLLKRLLDPPQVYISPELAKALDESSKTRGLMVDFFNNQLGVVNRSGPEEKAIRDSKRFDEDFRRRQSTLSILNEAEKNLVQKCCETLNEKKSIPKIRVITYSAEALPSFLPPESLMVYEAAFLASAHAVGAFLINPGKEKSIFENESSVNRKMIISEMSGGLLNLKTNETRDTSESEIMSASSSSSYDIARIKHAFLSVFRALSLSTMNSMSQRSNAIEQSRPFKILEEERRKHLPSSPKFDITLVHTNNDVKEEITGIVSIPLQLENAVVEQVLNIMEQEEKKEDNKVELRGYLHWRDKRNLLKQE
jgi:hypothetical protein